MRHYYLVAMLMACLCLNAQSGEVFHNFNIGEAFHTQKIIQTYDGAGQPIGFTRMSAVSEESPGAQTGIQPYLILSSLDPDLKAFWHKEYFLPNRDEDMFYPTDIIQTSDLGFAIVGYGFDPGSEQFYGILLKVKEDGSIEYTNRYFGGGAGSLKIFAVEQNPVNNNLIIAGENNEPDQESQQHGAFLTELNQFGNVIPGNFSRVIWGTKINGLGLGDTRGAARFNDITVVHNLNPPITNTSVYFGAAGVANEFYDLNGNKIESDIALIRWDEYYNYVENVLDGPSTNIADGLGEVYLDTVTSIDWHIDGCGSYVLLLGGGVEFQETGISRYKDLLAVSLEIANLMPFWAQTLNLNQDVFEGEMVMDIIPADDARFIYTGQTLQADDQNLFANEGFAFSVAPLNNFKITGDYVINQVENSNELITGAAVKGPSNTPYKKEASNVFVTTGVTKQNGYPEIRSFEGIQGNSTYTKFGCDMYSDAPNPVDYNLSQVGYNSTNFIIDFHELDMATNSILLNEYESCLAVTRLGNNASDELQHQVINKQVILSDFKEETVNYQVFSVDGKLIESGTSNKGLINLSALPQQLYILTVTNNSVAESAIISLQ